MSFKWDEPMNPYAERDFAHAVREATNNFSEELKRIGEQMKANVADAKISFIDFEDVPREYSGIMRLKADAYMDVTNVLNALLYNGYEVTMRLEDATETEKKLDGADKFVVIEYKEV